MFNEQGIAPFGISAMWYPSYIAKVINNRAVLGEYQPKQNNVPFGDPITGYYPAIISEDDFFKAQAIKKRKSPSAAGRKGKCFANLFTGMCKCLECGTTYRMQAGYMKCDSHYLSSGCSCNKTWKYLNIENAALLILKDEIDWFAAFGGQSDSRQKLESDLKALQGKLMEAEKQVSRFAELFSMVDDVSMLGDARIRYMQAMKDVSHIQQEIENKEAELRIYTPAQKNVERLNRIFFELASETDASALYQLRAQINTILRDSGLTLYFNKHGVYYYIKASKQKGFILIAHHEKILSAVADLEVVQHTLNGMNAFADELKLAA